MSACDRRAWYHTTNGLFKLRSSDGDLVWECRAISTDVAALAQGNLHVDRLDNGSLIVSGAVLAGSGFSAGLKNKGLIVGESSGMLASVTETGDVTTGGISNELNHLAYDSNDQFIYLCGQIADGLVFRDWLVNKYDLSGTFLGSRTILRSGRQIRARDNDQFDIVANTNSSNVRIRRYPGLTGDATAESDPLRNVIFDRYRRMLSDGTSYFARAGSFAVRIDAATLATAASSSTGAFGVENQAEVRDGLVVTATGELGGIIRVVDATSLTTLWTYTPPGSGRSFGASVCSAFAAVATSNDSDPFHLNVSRLESGVATWTTTLRTPTSLVTFVGNDDTPGILISEDQTRVYVWGTFALEPFVTTRMQLALYCLDATDGSVAWSFSAGGGPIEGGTNFQGGTSLYEEGDYVYLGTQRCRSPRYR